MKSNGTLEQLEDQWLADRRERAGLLVTGRDDGDTSGGPSPTSTSRRAGRATPGCRPGRAADDRACSGAATRAPGTSGSPSRARSCSSGRWRLIVVRSPGWPERQGESFFNVAEFKASFPLILRKFVRNIFIFCVAEVLVLIFALLIAVIRSLPGPVFRRSGSSRRRYTDLFRGVPTILVIILFGYGMPALDLQGIPDSDFVWADRGPDPRVLGVRRGGVSRGDRVRAPEPDRSRPLARPDPLAGDAPRRTAAGDPARDPAAVERLHRAAEGLGARLRAWA